MFKNLFGSLSIVALLVIAQSAAAALETWDMEFDGSGNPTAQGWTTFGFSSTTFTTDAKYTASGGFPGWFQTNGNAGGRVGTYYPSSQTGYTKAVGWTVEWRMSLSGYPGGEETILQAWDDQSDAIVQYNVGAGTVTLKDDWFGGAGASASVVLSGFAEHLYRLVRQPGSSTVELYIDNSFASPAAQLTVGDHGFLAGDPYWSEGGVIIPANSLNESVYDFFRHHSGATLPEPASLALMALGALVVLGRKR